MIHVLDERGPRALVSRLPSSLRRVVSGFKERVDCALFWDFDGEIIYKVLVKVEFCQCGGAVCLLHEKRPRVSTAWEAAVVVILEAGVPVSSSSSSSASALSY